MDRRGFVGTVFAGLGGFFFPQKVKAQTGLSHDDMFNLILQSERVLLQKFYCQQGYLKNEMGADRSSSHIELDDYDLRFLDLWDGCNHKIYYKENNSWYLAVGDGDEN